MEILVLITLLITIFSHLGCPHHFLIGDEFCNDLTNNVECNYDGGDCCVDINNEFCTDCTCYLIENCAAGFIPSVVGNDFCNDETNIANCNYDGGDCCGYTVNTDFYNVSSFLQTPCNCWWPQLQRQCLNFHLRPIANWIPWRNRCCRASIWAFSFTMSYARERIWRGSPSISFG